MMGQSLASAAVRGVSSDIDFDAKKRKLLDAGDITGLIELNRSVFGGWSMEKDDDGDDDNDDDGDGDDPDDDDDDDDEDDDDDPDARRKKRRAEERSRIQELSSESAKHRRRARGYRQRAEAAEAELEKLKGAKPKGKAKDEDDEDDADKGPSETETKLQKENRELKERLITQELRSEFNDLISGPKAKHRFKNPRTAFKLLDLDDVEITEDGEIEGLSDAIAALAKSDPYLLDTGKGRDDEDDDEDDDEPPAKRRTGQPVGRGRRGQPDREKLTKKYPALRR